VGLEVASRITTIGLEFVLPLVAGIGLDYWLGTTPAATLIGAVLGFVVGMLHAVRMSSELDAGPRRPGGRGN
jgi:F0F1-type ATP synthase assembly protein I